jgi:threonine dehydrogenase-like Zn-dependent dehydrogenase
VRALTVIPQVAGSARLEEVTEPEASAGAVLVAAEAVGICGTDAEILAGHAGAAPPGRDRLVLGHESLGRVIEAPADSGLAGGDRVVGIVRRPDPVPCRMCARGAWDMCENGRYTEHGIVKEDGFAAERYRLEPRFVVRIDPALGERGVLVEPTSVVVKAWEHIERIAARADLEPERVLVTGAGPVGLLAALLAVQRGLEVHVLDRARGGPKPALVRDLGATYHTGDVEDAPPPDVVLECTGAAALVVPAIRVARRNGIVCLVGVASGGRTLAVDTGALGRELVLENKVVFGSVNASRAHYQAAVTALARADAGWLDRLVTRRVPLDSWRDALEHRPEDVKTVLAF